MTPYDRASAKLTEMHRTEAASKGHTRDPVLSPADLEALANAAVEDHNEQLKNYGLPKEDASAFTCWSCTDASRCPHVFDEYNIDGDCIASK